MDQTSMNISNIKSFKLNTWELTWYSLIAVLGIIGNGVVMVVVLLSKNINRTSSFHIAIFSLAFADFMVSLLSLPTYIMSTDTFKNYHPQNISGDLMCIFITGYSLPYWFLDASVYLLVFISIERRNTILYQKFLLLQHKSTKSKIATMVLIFLIAFIKESFGASFLIYDPNEKQFGNFCKYCLDKNKQMILTSCIVILDTVIPVVIVSLCFYQISLSLKRIGVFLGKSMKVNKIDIIHIRKVKTIKTIKIIAVAFCICVLPNRILLVPSTQHQRMEWNNWISQVFVLMRLSNSFINPLIFCFQSQQFRKNLSIVFYRFYKRKSITSNKGKKQSNGYQQLPDMTF
ncbi:5-hydroxytryptamine receptor 4 [Hydra vulgaris]|uniref:5-hydroxytryptamine receptor 4 n=1 Tax=Hydra vulgaris TaxID=6087 RepID=UPI0002B4A7F5|nr:5-hydroxytryptamine receptor 4 [Hydra vulgaris]